MYIYIIYICISFYKIKLCYIALRKLREKFERAKEQKIYQRTLEFIVAQRRPI